MGKILVLAEKPSVGRELARVLGCATKREGSLYGAKYIVTWALGHLITLAEPERYGDQYKKWDLATLPMLPKKMETVVIRETAKQFHNVSTLLRSPEVESLVIATDAGREGELVARWIIEKAGFRKPMQRLWISSQTDRAIRDGFAHLRPAREYDNLYRSALCRAEADWLVGLNITRALTCKYNAQLSAGRVQTPTLAMIVQREEEIRKFAPVNYFTLTAHSKGLSLLWKDTRTGERRLFDQARAEALCAKFGGAKARVTQLKTEPRREAPPLLYDLTELQREANRRYGLTAKQTLDCMQRLYEVHKLLTYPRTDSRYLTSDIVPTLRERLQSVAVGPWAPFARDILKNGFKPTKRLVDNAKVTDHHAIIPTEQYVDLSPLSSDERRVYDLVVRRFLAALSSDFVYDAATLTAEAAGETLTARGRTVREKGWRAAEEMDSLPEEGEADEEREQSLPTLRQGDLLPLESVRLIPARTKPPARYTEATLLTAMEHPGKFIADGSLRETIDTANGIGTPATRAEIIERLFTASYVERSGKEIIPLSKGTQLIGLVPEELRSPELTARWEQRLDRIRRGTEPADRFIGEMRSYAARLVAGVVASEAAYRHDNMTRTPCPVCGKMLLEVNGKRGKMLVCPDRECGYRRSVSFLTNARCPVCHKKLEAFGEEDAKIYACHCGFREKAEAFRKRMEETHSGVSRREVQTYLARQQDAAPGQSAFAAAWARANGQGNNATEKKNGI